MPTISPTGNIATAINDIFQNYDQAINLVSDLTGALADASGAAGGVISLVQTIFNLGQPDEVQAALAAILNSIKVNFHALNEDLRANQILDRNTSLNDFFNEAKTQLQSLQAAIAAHPSPTEVVQFIAPCIKALDDLGGGNVDLVWNMNFDWQVYWTDEPFLGPGDVNEQYGRQAPDPNPDGATVFVYTYVLPLYIFTVGIFLAVSGSLDPQFIANYGNSVLGPAAALLRSRYEKITGEGLTQLSPPTPGVNDEIPNARGIITFSGGPIIIRYGAVEKFSGYSSVGSGYQMDLPQHSRLVIVCCSINYNYAY